MEIMIKIRVDYVLKIIFFIQAQPTCQTFRIRRPLYLQFSLASKFSILLSG